MSSAPSLTPRGLALPLAQVPCGPAPSPPVPALSQPLTPHLRRGSCCAELGPERERERERCRGNEGSHGRAGSCERVVEGKRRNQGQQSPPAWSPYNTHSFMASSAATLPPAQSSPQQESPPVSPPAASGGHRRRVTGLQATPRCAAADESILQAECIRLREELEQERAERRALAMRVDALSRLWEAAGIAEELPLAESASQATIEDESPGRSSVQTIVDESSIVPDSSAVLGLGLPAPSGAVDALRSQRHGREERSGVRMWSSGGQKKTSADRSCSPCNVEAHRYPDSTAVLKRSILDGDGLLADFADSHGVLAEITASNLLNHNPGQSHASKEAAKDGEVTPRPANGSLLAFYRKRCVEAAHEVRGPARHA